MYKIKKMNRRDFITILASSGAGAYLASFSPNNVLAVSMEQSREMGKEIVWPDYTEDFSAISFDKSGRLWVADVERPIPDRQIGVYVFEEKKKKKICTLKIPGMTGIAAPAITAFNDGCIICFPIEKDDKWRIGYAFLNINTRTPKINLLDCQGSSNISPAVTIAGDKACIVWESNAGSNRGIYSCFVDNKGAGKIERITAANANSYNPTVVSLANGNIFAAWDSVRNTGANIYGAWFRNGGWEPEQKITSDERIERHPFLASRGNDLWMTWQAQSYKGRAINNVIEQRIVTAKIDNQQLLCPKEFFAKVSTDSQMLLRPRIAFDQSGRLWLTARESIAQNSGWLPKMWCYSKNQWNKAKVLLDNQGRWRPVAIVVKNNGELFTSVQYDNLPQTWDFTPHGDRQSSVSIEPVSTTKQNSSELALEPLKMPETDFKLADKIKLCNADFQRHTETHNGEDLKVFWGDFHDHTDLSVCNRRKNPPGHDLFANERDIEKLDFCATTDHDFDYEAPQWQYNGEQTRQNHDPGRFVTFLAEEWTSSQNPPAKPGGFYRYGHHNLIFLDPYHDKFYNAYAGDISPADLWKQLEHDKVEFICIPHQLADWEHKGKANPPVDWNYVDEKYQPVAEIFQTRASYEYLGCPRQSKQGAPFKGNYLQDAWEKGIIIGVIASPDHGGGNGKVGVWAKDLNRKDIFEAVQARHTFGMSGSKMSLFFKSGNAIMGDKVQKSNGPISFQVKAMAMHNIKEIVIFRNNKIVYQAQPMQRESNLTWQDNNPPYEKNMFWYYARIHTKANELAWSSPIWFV